MALKKKVKESNVEQVVQEVESTKAISEEKNVTREESLAIINQNMEEKDSGASTMKLEKATALVSGKFGLDDSYSVTSFKDGGRALDITLENNEFIISVKVKDPARHGLIFED